MPEPREEPRAFGESRDEAEPTRDFDPLSAPTPRGKLDAIRAMSELGWAPEDVIPHLRRGLTNRERRVRMLSADELGALGVAAIPAIGDLLGRFIDDDPKVRDSVYAALRDIGAAVVRPVTELLASSDALVRQGALRVLMRLGASAQPSLTEVQKICRDNPEDRENGVRTLGALRVEDEASADLAAELLADPSRDVRQAAMDVLGHWGPSAIPALTRTLDSSNLDWKTRAAIALRRQEPTNLRVVASIVEGLKCDDPYLRRKCATVLGELASTSPQPAEALADARKEDDDKFVRKKAREAMSAIRKAKRAAK